MREWQEVVEQRIVIQTTGYVSNPTKLSGSPVQTTMGGRVIWVGKHGAWGNVVAVESGEWLVIFVHLSQVLVKENGIVRAGEIVGLSGSSPNSTRAHVRYEIQFVVKPIEPIQ